MLTVSRTNTIVLMAPNNGLRNKYFLTFRLNCHTERILHLAQAPDGVTVCSASADETLRFWRIFGQSKKGKSKDRGLLSGVNGIR